MAWVCPCCTLRNSRFAAVCDACEQPQLLGQQQAQPAEVIDLLDTSSDEAEDTRQQRRQQQLDHKKQKDQQRRQEQQQQQQQQQHRQHRQPAVQGAKGAAGMAAGGKNADALTGCDDSPSCDDSFQIELSDVTSSRRRRTLGTAGSASVKKQQAAGTAAVAGNGSGSSAETAVPAHAAAGGGKGAGPRLPPRPGKGAAEPAALPHVHPTSKERPEGSVTSGSPASLKEGTHGEQRLLQRQPGGKRLGGRRGPGDADTPSPAGLAGLSLHPSKKRKLSAASEAPSRGKQAQASGTGCNCRPSVPLATQPSGLEQQAPRHAAPSTRLQPATLCARLAAGADAQAALGPPRSATGSPDLQQCSPFAGGSAAPPAAAAAAGPGSGRPPCRPLPLPARGLPLPLKPRLSSKLPGKRLREEDARQEQGHEQQQQGHRERHQDQQAESSQDRLPAPSQQAAHPAGSQQQQRQQLDQQQQQKQQQQQQPVQATLRLPPRPPPGRGSSRSSPASGSGWAAGAQQAQQGKLLPPQELESSPESVAPRRRHSSAASPAGDAATEQQARHGVHQELDGGLDGGEAERQDGRQGPPAAGPQAFWRGLEAAYGSRCAPLDGAPPGAVGPAPAWVRRARQSAVDATPALLAAAEGCPPLELEGQGRHPRAGLASATQGWLAFRLATRLPEAAACRDAEELLELGAAAAAAAGPPPPLGAALVPRRQQGQGGVAGVGMCHVASRLLAAASRYQSHPMDLQERTRRWFQTRTPAFRKTLSKRLGDAFASTGGACAGGKRGGKRAGVAVPRGPHRLGRTGGKHGGGGGGGGGQPGATREGGGGGGGGAVRQAAGSGLRHPPAGRSVMTGVHHSGYGTFCGSSSVHSKQIWLGTYRTLEAAGRAVDLVWVWKWVRGGRIGALPSLNVPGNAYQQDDALLEQLESIQDARALVGFIKAACGAK